MNRPSGGNDGEPPRGAGSAALKGALLIGLAVIIGVFLLQRVDDSKTSATPTTKPKTTTTVKKSTPTTVKSTVTTTAPTTPAKAPDEVSVIVLNGGAAAGAAKTMSKDLLTAGYTNQPEANTWSGHSQKGDSVMCKAGMDREAVALSQQTPLQGAKVVPFASPAPPFSSNVDCVVVVGS